MDVKDAVALRFEQICAQQNITYNHLARLAGITPSTVYSLMDATRRDISIHTIKKLCDGLDISLMDFFQDELFDNLEPEIK